MLLADMPHLLVKQAVVLHYLVNFLFVVGSAPYLLLQLLYHNLDVVDDALGILAHERQHRRVVRDARHGHLRFNYFSFLLVNSFSLLRIAATGLFDGSVI